MICLLLNVVKEDQELEGNINQMYKNNGDGTYTNVAATANLADPEQTWSSAIGDFNNDGWMDIIVGVNSTSNGNTNVKRNNGDGTFTSVTAGSGFDTITAIGREYVAHDFDNDGNLDVLGSGNTIMFGDGNFHFTPNPNTYPLDAYNKPVGDLNNDGFLDIQSDNSVLFNNGNSNKWLKINLQGIQSNRNGIGARIEIYGAFGKQIRDVQSGTGFRNMSTLNTHFGLGSNTEVTQMIVRWPSGVVDTINNITANQTVLVVEGSSLAVNSFNNSTFTIYPNPVKSNINIVMSANSTVELKTAQVFDLNGRIVLETTISNQSINVDKLSTGTYILLLKDAEEKTLYRKIHKRIINHSCNTKKSRFEISERDFFIMLLFQKHLIYLYVIPFSLVVITSGKHRNKFSSINNFRKGIRSSLGNSGTKHIIKNL